jgi:endonuclease/exonuclease/phosphatase family metal-dependent hydrolase
VSLLFLKIRGEFMRVMLFVISVGVSLLTASATSGREPSCGRWLTVATYNVCNLFDTINDPGVQDLVLSPEEFREKVSALAGVVGGLAPDLLALCEVEKAEVVRELAATEPLDTLPYRVVHYDSPDRRGIDVAMLYRADRLRLVASEPIRAPEGYPTRDVLRAEFELCGTSRRLAVYVLHLPSRRGGYARAAAMREMVAAQVAELAATEEPEVGVVVLGDLNDLPSSGLVRRTLAGESSGLRCLTVGPHRRGQGSYAWRDTWLMYDHILVNGAVDAIGDARIFRRPEMLTPEGRFRGYPDRRISDHLPVYVRIFY